MTTYGIREFKARVSEILRGLDDGEEVIITRRGKPCGRLTSMQAPKEGKPSLGTLRGALVYLPDCGLPRVPGHQDAMGASGPGVAW